MAGHAKCDCRDNHERRNADTRRRLFQRKAVDSVSRTVHLPALLAPPHHGPQHRAGEANLRSQRRAREDTLGPPAHRPRAIAK